MMNKNRGLNVYYKFLDKLQIFSKIVFEFLLLVVYPRHLKKEISIRKTVLCS